MIDEKRLEKAFKEILIALGDDPQREGLKDTPKRAAGMYKELFEGMNYTNDELVDMFNKTFDEDYLTDSKNLVVVKDIDIFSHCELCNIGYCKWLIINAPKKMLYQRSRDLI